MSRAFDCNKLFEITNDETGSLFLEGSRDNEIKYSAFHAVRFSYLFSLVEKYSNKKILDVGTSPFTFYLARHTKNHIYTLDYSEQMKARCDKYGVGFTRTDLENSEIQYDDDFFDIIIFSEVFEHLLADPIETFKKFHKKLASGGVLFFTIPNLAILRNRINLLLNKPILDYPTWKISQDSIHGHGHNRLYTSVEVVEYAKKAGFSNIEVSYFSYPTNEKGIALLIKKLFINTILKIFPSLRADIYMTVSKE